MNISQTISRLRELEMASGGDCKCHCMKTCPDKAQEYWEYFDEYVPVLLDALEKCVAALKEIEDLPPIRERERRAIVRNVIEEINNER